MRVALVVHEFPSPEHPYITDWVCWLAEHGVEVTVLAEKSDKSQHYDFGVASFNSIRAPFLTLRANASPMISSVLRLGRIREVFEILHAGDPARTVGRKFYEYLPLLSESFDVVHFNSPQIAVRRFELGRILGGKTIVSFRGQDMTFHSDRYDHVLRDADHLHFLSHHLLELAGQRGYSDDRHTLIPPMVDTSFYCPTPLSRPKTDGGFCLFTSARLAWTKGWEFVLQAVALLAAAGFDVHYYIAGDGDYREAIAYTLHELKLANRVHLLGWLSPAEVRQWLWRCDLYVLGSVEEAFNNSVIQAQSCGVPVVCSDEGGLPENIQDQVTGLLARRRDAWDMAEKLRTLLERPEMRTRMGAAGRQRAQQHFSRRVVLPKFLTMYDSAGRMAVRQTVSAL